MEVNRRNTRMVEKVTLELKRLKRLKEHVPVLKITTGLSDSPVNEMENRINQRIRYCERIIRESVND